MAAEMLEKILEAENKASNDIKLAEKEAKDIISDAEQTAKEIVKMAQIDSCAKSKSLIAKAQAQAQITVDKYSEKARADSMMLDDISNENWDACKKIVLDEIIG